MKRKSLISGLALAAIVSSSIGMTNVIESSSYTEPPRKRKVVPAAPAYRSPRGRLPHIGAKERARHAGKPDGAMHGLPPLQRIQS